MARLPRFWIERGVTHQSPGLVRQTDSEERLIRR